MPLVGLGQPPLPIHFPIFYSIFYFLSYSFYLFSYFPSLPFLVDPVISYHNIGTGVHFVLSFHGFGFLRESDCHLRWVELHKAVLLPNLQAV